MKILLLAMLYGIILLMDHSDGSAPLRLPKAMRMRRLLPSSRAPSDLR
jgi:hypothetical protein